jgi:hypothetical protein
MKRPSTGANLAFETLSHYLKTRDWRVEKINEKLAFISQKDGQFVPLKYYFQIVPEHQHFLFYIVPQINVLDHQLALISEYICRANFGMRIGNFELDYNDGQVNFKSSINFCGTQLTDILIDGVIEPALKAFDEFFPGLRMVYAEIETPKEAIRKIEYGSQSA